MKRELDDSWVGKLVVLECGLIGRLERSDSDSDDWPYRIFSRGLEGTLTVNGTYLIDEQHFFDIDWDRTERITEHVLGLLAELHPVEAMMLGPFCDAVGLGVDALEVNS